MLNTGSHSDALSAHARDDAAAIYPYTAASLGTDYSDYRGLLPSPDDRGIADK
jgi:hypothetical protein